MAKKTATPQILMQYPLVLDSITKNVTKGGKLSQVRFVRKDHERSLHYVSIEDVAKALDTVLGDTSLLASIAAKSDESAAKILKARRFDVTITVA